MKQKSKVRKEAATQLGDLIQINFKVLDRSKVSYPHDLVAALKKEGLLEKFKSITPGKQNYIIRKIEESGKLAFTLERKQSFNLKKN